jgi:hypothetical protein
MTGLLDQESAVLAFERRWWKHAGAKEQAMADELGLSSTRYYQLLRDLSRRPEAQQHDPQLVNRLLRLEEQRARARSA